MLVHTESTHMLSRPLAPYSSLFKQGRLPADTTVHLAIFKVVLLCQIVIKLRRIVGAGSTGSQEVVGLRQVA